MTGLWVLALLAAFALPWSFQIRYPAGNLQQRKIKEGWLPFGLPAQDPLSATTLSPGERTGHRISTLKPAAWW